MDLLSASMHDSGILKANDEDWIMDNETDELLNSILTGDCGDNLPLFGSSDDEFACRSQFDQEILSPAASTGSSNNSATNNIDLIDILANDVKDEEPLQGVNPHTNSPDPEPPEKQQDDHDTDEADEQEAKQKSRVRNAVHKTPRQVRKVANRIASTNVFHHAGVKPTLPAHPARTVSVVRPSSITHPITLASPGTATLDTGTTTILLPVLSSVPKTPTIIRMSTPVPAKRRRVSGSSSDSGTDDGADKKYPRLDLNDEEKRLCEKEGIVLPSHYPLSKEEERNLKRIRRKIRNKLSAQDSRKRKKEYVDSMEAKAIRCAAENAELVKRLSMLETQNKTLVGQLRRLHQIIVNRGGIKSANAIAQAAMGNKGQPSTALMMLLLTTALFLIPGMKEQFESKPSLDIPRAVKTGPPMPGQSRSLLHFAPQNNIKEEFAPSEVTPKNDKIMSGFGDHDYVSLRDGVPPVKKSYIVADVPPLGYGDKGIAASDFDHEVVVVTSDPEMKQEDREEDDGGERQLSVNVTDGDSGRMRTVVLHVPRDIK